LDLSRRLKVKNPLDAFYKLAETYCSPVSVWIGEHKKTGERVTTTRSLLQKEGSQ